MGCLNSSKECGPSVLQGDPEEDAEEGEDPAEKYVFATKGRRTRRKERGKPRRRGQIGL